MRSRAHSSKETTPPEAPMCPFRQTVRYALPLVLCAALALPVVALAARAQAVRGEVRDPVTDVPVGGAIVSLVDRDGRVVARTLSNADGRYILGAPTAGRFSLIVERVGRVTQ